MVINHIKLKMKKYSTNLTESQWKTILNILEDKRKRKHCLTGQTLLNFLGLVIK